MVPVETIMKATISVKAVWKLILMGTIFVFGSKANTLRAQHVTNVHNARAIFRKSCHNNCVLKSLKKRVMLIYIVTWCLLGEELNINTCSLEDDRLA